MDIKVGDFVVFKNWNTIKVGVVVRYSPAWREYEIISYGTRKYPQAIVDGRYFLNLYMKSINHKHLVLLNNHISKKQYLSKIKPLMKAFKKDDDYERQRNQEPVKRSIEHYKSLCLRDTKKWLCFAWAYGISSFVLLYLVFIYS